MIVLDSNIFFSALIKESYTRRIIIESEEGFLFPEYIFIEMKKYINDLMQKSGIAKEDFDKLISLLLDNVEVVSEDKLLNYKEEAINIIGKIDIKDTMFFACALAHPGSIIWSDDKRLKKQNQIEVVNSLEIKKYIKRR